MARRCLRYAAMGMVWCCLALPAFSAELPSFVIFLTDDQRWDALSCAGNKILQTPHIDKIAREGLLFKNAFVTTSLSAPSRVTILTGQYSHTHGVKENQNVKLPAATLLLPEFLKEKKGYEVAFCGKSKLGPDLAKRKWDYFFAYDSDDYLNPTIFASDGKPQSLSGYVDDIVTQHAIEWLKKKRDKPFCLFLWFNAPHRPWIRARRHHDLFANVPITKPATYDDDQKNYPGKPKAFTNAKNRVGEFADVRSLDFIRDYYATLVAVDENVGKVYAVLQAMNKLDNTVIIFTSDNGYFLGEWRMFGNSFMHEPSIRVPLVIRYPKAIPKPGTRDSAALNVDIAPTVLQLAEIPIPKEIQGLSLVPLFAPDAAAVKDWRKEGWLYEYFENPGPQNVRKHRGIRTPKSPLGGPFKFIHYFEAPEEFELYDLEKDPLERNNLYGNPMYQKVVDHMKLTMEKLRTQTGDNSK
ncbi:MAG: acetylglucosamine-6-sulfatase [Gemmatales bacterium]|nr:MAG: acetylglucosamine-6-sulfatase [Gemmatales bacterium]